MKAALLAAGFCLATTAALDQASTAWINERGGVSIALDAADNVFTVTWEFNPAGDITLTKRNSAGSVLWQAKFDKLDTTRHEVATWVATDRAGSALVAGTIRSETSNPVNVNSVLMKFSPQGQLLWRQVHAVPFDGSSTTRVLTDTDTETDTETDTDNTVYVFGLGTGPFGQVTTVRKFAPDGSVVWAGFDPLGIGAPVNLKWTPDRHLPIIARGFTGANNGEARIDRNGSLLTERLQPVAGLRVEVPSDQARSSAASRTAAPRVRPSCASTRTSTRSGATSMPTAPASLCCCMRR